MLRWLKSEQYEVKQFVFCSSIDNIFEKSLFWANAVCKNDELFALLFVRKKEAFKFKLIEVEICQRVIKFTSFEKKEKERKKKD